MKKIFFIILILSFSAFAEGPDWPSQLFSANKVYQNFLRPFQNYFRDVNRDYIIINSSPTVRMFSYSRDMTYNFKISIQRILTDESITEVINYTVKDTPAGRILIKRIGKNLQATTNEDLFTFKLPLPTSADKFQLIFEDGLGLKMNFSNTGNLLSGTMELYSGEVLVFFSESERDVDFYTRSLWYICNGCDSSVLIANAQKVGKADWQYFYKVSSAGQMTSQDFYNTYTNYYAPPMTDFFASILKNFEDTYRWP